MGAKGFYLSPDQNPRNKKIEQRFRTWNRFAICVILGFLLVTGGYFLITGERSYAQKYVEDVVEDIHEANMLQRTRVAKAREEVQKPSEPVYEWRDSYVYQLHKLMDQKMKVSAYTLDDEDPPRGEPKLFANKHWAWKRGKYYSKFAGALPYSECDPYQHLEGYNIALPPDLREYHPSWITDTRGVVHHDIYAWVEGFTPCEEPMGKILPGKMLQKLAVARDRVTSKPNIDCLVTRLNSDHMPATPKLVRRAQNVWGNLTMAQAKALTFGRQYRKVKLYRLKRVKIREKVRVK